MSPSRRGFLGFLIAAPVAARLPAPAAVDPFSQFRTAPGTVKQIVWRQTPWVTARGATVRPSHRVIR